MLIELGLLTTYRLMAFVIAALMVFVLFRASDPTTRLFAMIVFVPFALRAAGIK